MSAGRFQLGEDVWLRVQCRDSNRQPAWPTEAPTLVVFSASGLILSRQIPTVDYQGQKGLFGYRLFLNSIFAAGYYRCLFRYRVGSFQAMEEDSFEVLAGGDPDGSVIALFDYEQPSGDFLLQQRDGGRLFAGANPRW